jgi:hypothetical protein
MAGWKTQALENRGVILMKFRNGEMTQKDVKNEECSG